MTDWRRWTAGALGACLGLAALVAACAANDGRAPVEAEPEAQAAATGPAAAAEPPAEPAADAAAPAGPPPEGWQMYRNERFGFELGVPPELEAAAEELVGGAAGAPLLRVRFRPRRAGAGPLAEREPAPFTIVVFANPDELGAEAWLERTGWPFAESIRRLAEVETGAGTALEVSSLTQQAPGRHLYLAHGAYLLRLTPLGGESERMLASLRLLE